MYFEEKAQIGEYAICVLIHLIHIDTHAPFFSPILLSLSPSLPHTHSHVYLEEQADTRGGAKSVLAQLIRINTHIHSLFLFLFLSLRISVSLIHTCVS